MKIIFTGAQSTGKTTTFDSLSGVFPNFEMLKEVIRDAVKKNPNIKINEEGDYTSQNFFFDTYSLAFSDKQNVISDRGMLDVVAYSKYLMEHGNISLLEYRTIFNKYVEYLKNNDDVYYIFFPIQFPAVEDGLRSCNEDFRKDIETCIQYVFEEVSNYYPWLKSHVYTIGLTGKEERSNEVIEYIKKVEESEKTDQAVVSFSGGLDSTCLALKLLSEGYKVKAITFDYGQTHNIETKLAKKNVKYLQSLNLPIELQVINLKDVFMDSGSCLLTHEEAPKGDYEQETMLSTVVENRNVIFSAIMYSKALAWANKSKKKVVISLGVHAGDHSLYPDCTPESVNMSKQLYKISNWGSENVRYETPFVNINKGEVLKNGLNAMKAMNFTRAQRNKVLRNTNSCYNNTEGYACGECGTCKERLEAFAANKLKDPIKYAK